MSSFFTEIAVYFMSNKEMSYLIMNTCFYGLLNFNLYLLIKLEAHLGELEYWLLCCGQKNIGGTMLHQ